MVAMIQRASLLVRTKLVFFFLFRSKTSKNHKLYVNQTRAEYLIVFFKYAFGLFVYWKKTNKNNNTNLK